MQIEFDKWIFANKRDGLFWVLSDLTGFMFNRRYLTKLFICNNISNKLFRQNPNLFRKCKVWRTKKYKHATKKKSMFWHKNVLKLSALKWTTNLSSVSRRLSLIFWANNPYFANEGWSKEKNWINPINLSITITDSYSQWIAKVLCLLIPRKKQCQIISFQNQSKHWKLCSRDICFFWFLNFIFVSHNSFISAARREIVYFLLFCIVLQVCLNVIIVTFSSDFIAKCEFRIQEKIPWHSFIIYIWWILLYLGQQIEMSWRCSWSKYWQNFFWESIKVYSSLLWKI